MQKQKDLVDGLGASGEACTQFLLKRDWQVEETDTWETTIALGARGG